jgi:3-hydroxybutyryl-CoA dehydratase
MRSSNNVMRTGETLSWRRTFSEDDIRLFAQVSGDEGEHHLDPDEKGRLMVHGLLTATLPTKIGGDLNFIAREMTFHFHRPVFAGDTLECVVTLVAADPADGYTRVASEWRCTNQHGKEVMTGSANGIVRDKVA